jgi:hypothetical protein
MQDRKIQKSSCLPIRHAVFRQPGFLACSRASLYLMLHFPSLIKASLTKLSYISRPNSLLRPPTEPPFFFSPPGSTMSQFYGAPPNNQGYMPQSAQNLQFYPSSYSPGVPSHGTPSQGSYGYGAPASSSSYGAHSGFNSGFGAAPGVSGRMGEQGGLRTGWLAAFSTEGYDGEPPLLEELGIDFHKIQAKVRGRIR